MAWLDPAIHRASVRARWSHSGASFCEHALACSAIRAGWMAASVGGHDDRGARQPDARCANTLTSNAPLTQKPQHVVLWRIRGKGPPPVFRQTKRTIPVHLLGGGDPHPNFRRFEWELWRSGSRGRGCSRFFRKTTIKMLCRNANGRPDLERPCARR